MVLTGKLMMLGLMLAMTGCSKTIGAGIVAEGPSCDKYQHITWSKEDTQETVKQVKGHNAVHELCKAKK